MAIWIYSAEAFPGTNGRNAEYIQVLGHTIVVPARQWVKLQTRYERPYWTDYRHRGEGSTNKAVGHASREVFVNDEVAAEIVARYGFRGVVMSEDDPAVKTLKCEKLVATAETQNHKWREHIIARFENERKQRSLTGHGRLEPTPYELECYRECGLPEPGSIDEIKAEKGISAKEAAVLSPEILVLIQEALETRARKAAEAAAMPLTPPVAMTEAQLEEATRPAVSA